MQEIDISTLCGTRNHPSSKVLGQPGGQLRLHNASATVLQRFGPSNLDATTQRNQLTATGREYLWKLWEALKDCPANDLCKLDVITATAADHATPM